MSLAALLILLLVGQEVRPAEPVFRDVMDVSIAGIDVQVTDRDGLPVTGLGRDDFRLKSGKRNVPIVNFFEAREPSEELTLVLVIDNFNLRAANRDRAMDALRDDLRWLMEQTQARAMVIALDPQPTVVQELTADFLLVSDALATVRQQAAAGARLENRERAVVDSAKELLRLYSGSIHELRVALASLDGTLAELRVYGQSVGGEMVRTVEGLGALVSSLGGIPGRKTVIYLADGLAWRPLDRLVETLRQRMATDAEDGSDLAAQERQGSTVAGSDADTRRSGTGSVSDTIMPVRNPVTEIAELQESLEQLETQSAITRLVGLANACRVTFYSVRPTAGDAESAGAREVGKTLGLELSDTRGALEYLAQGTGGGALTTGREVSGFLRSLLSDLTHYYSLGFVPPDKITAGSYMPLRLRLKKGRGYRLRSADGLLIKSFERQLADRTISAMVLGFETNPHGLTASVMSQERGADGRYEVDMLIRVPIDRLELVPRDGAHHALARLAAVVRSARGQLSPAQHHEMPLAVPDGDLEVARANDYAAQITLHLAAGEQTVALGLWDQNASRGSFVSQRIRVGDGD